MSGQAGFDSIFQQLKAYKQKYNLNALLRGVILFLALNLAIYFLLSSLEYSFRFSTTTRALMLFTFLTALIVSFYIYMAKPLIGLLRLNKSLSDEEAAKQIGIAFPEISDKLLNALQLMSISQKQSDLVMASLQQRTAELKWYKFPKAINFNDNRRFFKYLIGPAFLVIIFSIFIPELFSESNERLINYRKAYVPLAPFRIEFLNDELKSFKNEDFEMQIRFEGGAIPEQAYLISGQRKIRLKKNSEGQFEYMWRKVQKNEDFRLEAAGFVMGPYTLEVLPRPELRTFEVSLNYPDYTGIKDEKLSNIGNFSAPEGTLIKWSLTTQDADSIEFLVLNSKNANTAKVENNFWSFRKTLNNSFNYSLSLKNNQNIKRKLVEYSVKSIKDQYPEISTRLRYDSTLFNYILLGGNINDDYGFTNLQVRYEIIDKNNTKRVSGRIPLEHSSKLSNQNFVFNWTIDSLDIQKGERLEYFVEVFDNDGVNGPKSSKSRIYQLNIPEKSEVRDQINKSSKSIEDKLNDVQKNAKELNEDLKDIIDDSKAKKSLKWEDKNKIEQALKKHEALKDKLDEINKELEKNSQLKERFDEQDEELKEKTESLKKLMNELLDEETKNLLKELQKLLEENKDKNQMQNKLEDLEDKSYDLEKELDRAIELFKQLQFEERLEKTIEDLNELSEEQEKLSEQTEDKSLDNKELQEKQEELNEKFDEIQKELDEIKKLDESMENPNEMDDSQEDREDIEESMRQSSDELSKNKKKKASESQKNSSEKMKKLSEKMSDFMMGMQGQNLMEDMNNLRQILENLITLSFDQEKLMKEFRQVNQSDPRYVELGQEQLKLKDDAKVIEDSLYALAKRVFQIESFVTREVNEMNDNIDEALEAIRDRRNGLAAGKQQFAMTSINNLALMLNDVLKQMQEQMAQQMEGDQMCNKPKQGGKPSLSQMQKQLNNQIRELKQSGKQGRELSEELAKLAREQEELRKMMKSLGDGEGQLDENAQKKLKDLEKIMEESEKDLVHKQLTQELLERQEEILTRLLESEKAAREQKMDPTRESQTGKLADRKNPPDLEKFLKEKDRQTELLKSISPNLNPYYRDRVNEYFDKIYE